MIMSFDEREVYYDICGNENGAPVLFLHGWGSSSDAFARIIRPLCSRFRCITVDLPGCGRSDEPRTPLALSDYTALIVRLLGIVNAQSPIIVGHSNGGRIALELASRHLVEPEKLILLGAAGLPLEKSKKQQRRTRRFKRIRTLLTLPPLRPFTAELLAAARAHYGSADYNSATPVMRQTLVNLLRVDLTEQLRHITASTLLIWGECDTATPLYTAKVMEREIPDCGLCVLEGCTHWCFIEQPERVNAIIESFLS